MFRVEPGVLRAYFDESLCRGAVVRIEDYPFLNESVRRPKYFVILNRDCRQSEIFHFLTTSKVAKYKVLAFRDFGVSVPAGINDGLTAPETIVDCYRLMPVFKRAFLLEQLCTKGITIHPPLPTAFMDQVDSNINRSRTIPSAIKALIA